MSLPVRSLFVLAMLGCNTPVLDVDAAATDAAAPDGGTSVVVARPSWGTCPAGWVDRIVEGAATCAPPPRVACTGATFQLPGSAACAPVDDRCDGDRFPTDLLAGRAVLFVDASAPAGGDGTEARPFATLADALDASGTAPTSIALAAGDYTGRAIAAPADLELHGVCADRVRLISSTGMAAMTVRPGARVHVAGVTVTGEGRGLTSAGELVVRGVVLEGVRGAGIGLTGGTFDGARLLVRGTRSDEDGSLGRGLSLEGGATATLTDAVIDGSHEAGIAVGGATIDATRIAIERTMPRPDGRYGAGVAGFEAATIALRESLISGASEAGVTVEADTELTVDAVVIEDVVTEAAMPSGQGVVVRNARGTLTRVVIERASGTGLLAIGTSVETATDVLVLSTQRRGDFASGISSLEGAELTLARAMVLDSAWVGIAVLAATLRATDLVVRRVVESRDIGAALLASEVGTADLERFELEEAQGAAVMVIGAGSSARLVDGRVRHVTETAAYGVGRGIEVDVGGHLEVTRVTIEDVVETALVAYGGALDETTATLIDVHVREIHERACASSSCPTEGGGTGLAAVYGAVVTAERLAVEGAPLCGVQVAESASLDIASGAISESAIGACVQIEGYELARIVSGVIFRDNERNVETASAYVPPRGPVL